MKFNSNSLKFYFPPFSFHFNSSSLSLLAFFSSLAFSSLSFTEDMSYDLLTSVVIYAGFVDANCLIYLWPEEFDSCRICVISGSFSKPIFSCFLSEVQ